MLRNHGYKRITVWTLHIEMCQIATRSQPTRTNNRKYVKEFNTPKFQLHRHTVVIWTDRYFTTKCGEFPQNSSKDQRY